jgi:hypothetical protein
MWNAKAMLRRIVVPVLGVLPLVSVLPTVPANGQTAHKASRLVKASVPSLPPPAPVLEPKAIEILKAACAKLAAAHSMSFTAVISYENPSRLGPPLIYTEWYAGSSCAPAPGRRS